MRAALLVLLLAAPALADLTPPPSGSRPPAGSSPLVGTHRLQLHWIGWWKQFGKITIQPDDKGNQLVAHGEQRKGDDFLTVDGVFTRVTDRELTFRGTIVARVAENVGGVACKREGTLHFRRSGQRKYFRLVEMRNPCQPDGERLVDYIDIFLD